MPDDLTLAAEFPTATREQWLGLVDKVLKGAPFDKKLVTTTADGIALQPLYTADMVSAAGDEAGFPGDEPHTRGALAPPRPYGAWDVRTTLLHPDPAKANQFALDDLFGGVTSLEVRFDRAARRGAGPGSASFDTDGGVDGVAIHDADALDRALAEVYLDLAPIALRPGASFTAAATWLADVWARRGVGGAQVSGSLGADPLGTLASEGVLPQGLDAALVELAELAAATAGNTPNVAAIDIDLGPYVEAGATPAQQLAILLSTGAAYLRAAEAAGLAPADAASQIQATLVLDADVFTGVATCRAARRLWDAMLGACGVDPAARGLRLHVRTAARMMTRRDPWVNLLRVTAATFGAGVGGADGVTALPFDVELGFPNELGRRMARNTQLLLIEESHVGRVIDPAGGSWYVESFTEELAENAWTVFGELESAGGMATVLTGGTLAARLADSWSARLKDVARRKEPITGVSEFPFLGEAPVVRDVPDPAAVRAAATGEASHVGSADSPTVIDALPAHRTAEPVEALRDAADAFKQSTGALPQIFLVNLGPVASNTARSSWAKNFYESGGIESVGVPTVATAEEAAAAFTESGARVACLCGSDGVYAELAETTAKALVAAGAIRVELAGKPGDAEEAYRSAGVEAFGYVGVDQVAHLRELHRVLGVVSTEGVAG